jgi:hypothetical protein
MVNQQRGHQKRPAPRMGRTNYTTMEEIPMGEEVLAVSKVVTYGLGSATRD